MHPEYLHFPNFRSQLEFSNQSWLNDTVPVLFRKRLMGGYQGLYSLLDPLIFNLPTREFDNGIPRMEPD